MIDHSRTFCVLHAPVSVLLLFEVGLDAPNLDLTVKSQLGRVGLDWMKSQLGVIIQVNRVVQLARSRQLACGSSTFWVKN